MGELWSSSAGLLVLAMVALGKLLSRTRAFPPSAPETLNRFVIDVSLPALVLASVHDLSLDAELLGLALLPWALLVPVAILLFAIARWRGWSPGVTGALLLCVPLGNTAFLGYPVTAALIGPDAVPLAVLYDQFGTFLGLTTFGLAVAAYFGQGQRPTVRDTLLRVVRFPPFLALAVALLPIRLPALVLEIASLTAASLVPAACVAVGLQLRLRMPQHLLAPLALGLAVKLLAMPVAASWIGASVGLSGDLLRVGVLESAMPPMITAGAVAAAAKLEPELAAALVGFGIVLSFVSMPLLLAWL